MGDIESVATKRTSRDRSATPVGAANAATAALDAADSKIEVFLDIGSDLDSLEERAFDLIQVINGVLNHTKNNRIYTALFYRIE